MENISLVIPLKDEEEIIQGLIDSIKAQTVLPDEVIFVDAGSGDKTKFIVKNNLKKVPFKIKLVEMRKAYPGEARNVGIKESSCELIAFTDGGITLDKWWLKELMRPLKIDGSVDVVYGVFKPVVNSFIKECSLIAYIPAGEKIGDMNLRTNSIASSLFKKSMCERAGGFPSFRAAEDKIFMDKVKNAGAKISYTDKAIAYWEIPGSINGIFRRFTEFSAHDIFAGKAGDWHYSVFRTYGIFLLLFLLGVFVNRFFFWGIFILWLMRIARIFFKKRKDFEIKFLADLRYLFVIAFIVLVTDIALFCGSMKYLWMRHENGK